MVFVPLMTGRLFLVARRQALEVHSSSGNAGECMRDQVAGAQFCRAKRRSGLLDSGNRKMLKAVLH
jgi:hypothetical protein